MKLLLAVAVLLFLLGCEYEAREEFTIVTTSGEKVTLSCPARGTPIALAGGYCRAVLTP